MIQLGQLTSIADRDGVEARIVERDYVLMHVLSAIYRREDVGNLVFKGGTLLRACYFADCRYSADLDFSLRAPMGSDEAVRCIGGALARCRDEVGFESLEVEDTDDELRIVYRRPGGALGRIKLNLTEGELVGEPERVSLIGRYLDLPGDVMVVAYGLVEVSAEKLRCVMQRVQARDLIDLHSLLVQHRVDVDDAWLLFTAKALHKELDPRSFAGKLAERAPVYQKRWEDELSGYMRDVPPFERVDRELRGKLRPFMT